MKLRERFRRLLVPKVLETPDMQDLKRHMEEHLEVVSDLEMYLKKQKQLVSYYIDRRKVAEERGNEEGVYLCNNVIKQLRESKESHINRIISYD